MREPKSSSVPLATSPASPVPHEQATTAESAEPALPASIALGDERATDEIRSDETRRTLADELGTRDFAERGWFRLADLADYLAHLVDGRSVGLFSQGDPSVFARVSGLASVLKAAAQWFATDGALRPAFVVEAEKYLATHPEGLPFQVLLPPELAHNLRTGPVTRKKSGKGPSGRVHELAELKARLVALLEPLTDLDREAHVIAHRDLKNPRPKERWILPHALAGEMFLAFAHGTLSDLLREHDFRWNWDSQFPLVVDALAELFEYEVRLEPLPGVARTEHLKGIAQQVIATTLDTIAIPVPKDFFRDRRGI